MILNSMPLTHTHTQTNLHILYYNHSQYTVRIGWQSATYQAAESPGAPTVEACAQVHDGVANIGTRTITIQVSTNPNTALGKQTYKVV